MAEKDLVAERLRKKDQLAALGVEAYAGAYRRTTGAGEVAEDSGPVSLAGRLTALRVHGKAAFADLRDMSGSIQLYLRSGGFESEFDVFRLLDIGDIVGVRGEPFRTRTGQLTVGVTGLSLLAKSIRPMPEKWHGLKDVETRSRRRYLDLAANPGSREVFVTRSRVLSSTRRFLDDRGYLEVETPMMHPIPGGALARPFVTRHNALGLDLYLRIAPELYLKRLLVGGFEKVYEINRSFRNEGVSSEHNPEFTMLELYAAYGDYQLMADTAEEMILSLFDDPARPVISRGGREIDCSPPWRRVTMAELFRTRLGLEKWRDAEALAGAAASRRLPVEDPGDACALIDLLFSHCIQPELLAPTFVLDYPEEISPLARSKPDSPGLVERFELFIGGLEVGNAYSELNDPAEQRRRFEAALAGGSADGSRCVDEDYLEALSYGMPPAGGLGIGIDRLTMLLAGRSSIREVILFPLLRPGKESGGRAP